MSIWLIYFAWACGLFAGLFMGLSTEPDKITAWALAALISLFFIVFLNKKRISR